jgi:crotonobetainyl-CoA:carnitine CoA-transferase CaiB-like acyl-CoA transferase
MTGDAADTTDVSPLRGLVVVDASTVIAGPMAAAILGDYGARIIKVEHPIRGDDGRRVAAGGLAVDGGQKPGWTFLARNKECVGCDLKTKEGVDVFKRLASKADVVIENFRPGTLESWGIDYAGLSRDNPGLVMLRISGFGQTGPYSSRPGYGTLAAAMTGLQFLTGEMSGPPILPGAPIADAMTAYLGALAVMMVLWERQQQNGGGKGRVIDLPLYGGLLYMYGAHIAEASLAGVSHIRRGNNMPRFPTIPVGGLMGSAECSDGNWVSYSMVADRFAVEVATFLEQHGVSEAAMEKVTNPATGRVDKVRVGELMKGWISGQDRSTVLSEFERAGIPMAPVYSMTDLLDDPHYKDREEFIKVPSGQDGNFVEMPGGPFRLDGQLGGRLRSNARDAIGEDNVPVYRDFVGLSEQEIETLHDRRVI